MTRLIGYDAPSVEVEQVVGVLTFEYLRVDVEWLADSDRGEWGEELVSISDDDAATKLLDDNIEDIDRLCYSYIVVTGLAHVLMNEGMIYRVGRGETET